ncbi:integrin beta-like protein A [Amphiura filiformis]|uniref:integrin beta-like protein A n=1 Tax=Amphiura filiformis TaxID=82378 RepID=UPI003B220323
MAVGHRGTVSVSLLLFWVSSFISTLYASHFRGAIITWDSLDEPNQVEISWRISWRRSAVRCDQSLVDSAQLVTGEGNLQCYSGCSGSVSPMSFYCTDFSTEEDWSTGVNSIVYDAPTPEFGVRFTGNDWINLNDGGGRWSLPATVNLTRRADIGRPNSSPRSAVTPIVRLQHGCNHTLVIPTNDPDGDIVRCRWAEGSDECAGVCKTFPNSLLEETTCTLRYEAVYQTGWYAVALMIEDFAHQLSSTPLSKIPLQFLVLVYSNDGPCSSAPEFVDPTPKAGACVGIPPNTTFSEPLVARTGDSSVSILAIETVSPIGFFKSDVGKLQGVDRHYYVNLTWTPQLSQYGENIFCFTAADSVGLSSDQQCVTYVAGVAAPEVIPASLEPPPGSEILSSHSTWRMKFDAEFVRPTKPTFIRFYTSGGTNVYSIDVASRSDALYLSSLDRSVEFSSTGLALQEKQTYYILMESGITKGLEFCGPESSAVRDRSFWTVKIKIFTPRNFIGPLVQVNFVPGIKISSSFFEEPIFKMDDFE